MPPLPLPPEKRCIFELIFVDLYNMSKMFIKKICQQYMHNIDNIDDIVNNISNYTHIPNEFLVINKKNAQMVCPLFQE